LETWKKNSCPDKNPYHRKKLTALSKKGGFAEQGEAVSGELLSERGKRPLSARPAAKKNLPLQKKTFLSHSFQRRREEGGGIQLKGTYKDPVYENLKEGA